MKTQGRLNFELWLVTGTPKEPVQMAGRGSEHREIASCLTPYQVDVHLGVAQGTAPSVAGYDTVVHLIHRLLCYQINGKVLIHLE